MRKDSWRQRSRSEIEETAVAARDAVLRAKSVALQKTKEVDTPDGPVLEPLDIGDELDRIGYALLHVQAAENKLSYLRNLLTKRQERLETERERQVAYGDDTYELFMRAEGSKKQKRIPPEALKAAIRAEWSILNPTGSSLSRRVARRQVGRALGVSESTVQKYLREIEREGVAT